MNIQPLPLHFGGDQIEEHKEEGYMLTSSGMNLVSAEAVTGAWTDSIDKENTKVAVVTLDVS